MAIPNIWTVAGSQGQFNTFSALNLGQVIRVDRTLLPDTLAFRSVQAYDGDPLFTYGETITVKRNAVVWFKGTCTSIRRIGSGSSERVEYMVSGPWWQLEQIIYQQPYNRYVNGQEASATLSRLILGTDSDGEKINSGQVIADVVNYATGALGGASLFQRGSIDPATDMPFEELQTLTCAEVIKRVLRWNPDTVSYFDYTSSPPTLHLRKRANLPSVDLAISDVVITSNSINPRNDLQKDGVVVKYERTDTVDDQEKLVVETDSAGDTNDPLKTLHLFFDLKGSSSSTLQQEVVSKTILENSESWWKARSGKLQGASSITVTNGEVAAIEDEEGESEDYDKELIEGSIAKWMPTNVKAWPQLVTAEISYVDADGVPHSDKKFRLQLMGTNADSKTYTAQGDYDPAEPTPVGLASQILSSIQALHYEGQAILVEQECGSEIFLSKTLNITGGRTEWASMNAQVYSTIYNIDEGTTTIRFGPAKHLSADDLFHLFRNVRTRKPASGAIRIESNPTNSLGSKYPNTVSEPDSGNTTTQPLNAYKTDLQKIKVKVGTINGVEVTAASGSSLDDAESTVYTGSKGWVKVTLDEEGGNVQSAIIQNTDPGQDTTTVTSRLAYSIDFPDGKMKINNMLSGSQSLESCGTFHTWIAS